VSGQLHARPLNPRGESHRYPLDRWLGGSQSRSGKFLPSPGLELRPLCRPARIQSLYRLCYPGSSVIILSNINLNICTVAMFTIVVLRTAFHIKCDVFLSVSIQNFTRISNGKLFISTKPKAYEKFRTAAMSLFYSSRISQEDLNTPKSCIFFECLLSCITYNPYVKNTHSLSQGADAANCVATQEIIQHFMEPVDSLPCSQDTSTCPYPEPDQSNPYHPILSF
jgi:hypothetical protein